MAVAAVLVAACSPRSFPHQLPNTHGFSTDLTWQQAFRDHHITIPSRVRGLRYSARLEAVRGVLNRLDFIHTSHNGKHVTFMPVKYNQDTKAKAIRLVREFTDRPVSRPGRPASPPAGGVAGTLTCRGRDVRHV